MSPEDILEKAPAFEEVVLDKDKVKEDIPEQIHLDLAGELDRFFPEKYSTKSAREVYITKLLISNRKKEK